MALTVTSPLTQYTSCDTTTGTSGVDGVDTDIKVEGVAAWASDVDIETDIMLGPTVTAINMDSGNGGADYGIYPWVLCMTANYLDIKANGGIAIVLADSAGNENYYNCGGSDTYPGGWEVMVANSGATPDGNSGTAADMTDIVRMGVKWKGVAKSKLADNCFVDDFRYGSGAALKVTGTNTVADAGWSEVFSGDEALVAGIIKVQKGGYVIKGPVQIGDDTGTLSTDFSDSSTIIVFDDMPVGATHNKILMLGNGTGTTDIDLSSQVIKSAGERFGLDTSDTNLTSLSITGSTVAKAGLVTHKAGQTISGNVFQDCLQIDPSTSTFDKNTITQYVGADGALLWPGGTSVNTCTFSDNDRAIEITQTANQTFDALLFPNNTYDVHLNNGGNDISVSKNNGSDPTSYITTGGGIVSFVGSSVTVKVVAQKGDGTKLDTVRVLLKTSEAGSLPYLDSVTIVNATTTATVTHTGHDLSTGDKVVIDGASHLENNGIFTITVTGINTYTYTMSSAPGSSPTGTITSTFVYVSGTTDALGVISESRVYPASQAATGWARKSSSSPYYKTGPLAGTVSSAENTTFTAILSLDE